MATDNHKAIEIGIYIALSNWNWYFEANAQYIFGALININNMHAITVYLS